MSKICLRSVVRFMHTALRRRIQKKGNKPFNRLVPKYGMNCQTSSEGLCFVQNICKSPLLVACLQNAQLAVLYNPKLQQHAGSKLPFFNWLPSWQQQQQILFVYMRKLPLECLRREKTDCGHRPIAFWAPIHHEH